MTTRRWLSTVLMGTTLMALAPVNSWAAGPGQPTADLHAAIRTAAARAAASPALQMIPVRPTSDKGVRKQSTGGGHVMMVVTILGTVAGLAATVYAVKQMQKSTKNLTGQNP